MGGDIERIHVDPFDRLPLWSRALGHDDYLLWGRCLGGPPS